MKQILVIAACVLALGACSSTERGAAVGAAGGAAIGAASTGTLQGAAIGGVAGAAAGALLGKVAGSDDMCYYRDADGNTYKAECPQG